MQRLWAPWRSKYVKSKKEKGCIFCLKPKAKKDKENYIVKRGKHAFVILNIYPYNNGHAMIAPYRHVGELDKLKKEELIEIMELTQEMIRRLKKVLKPHAFNCGFNLGDVAGAGYADHLHIHIVPRWQGDTNFIPVIGDTKVIPQSLNDLYDRLIKQK
jgi:ATP adenylyltransferase